MLGPVLLTLGVILTVVAGAAMGWYPARLGGPANWLDDHLYRVPVSLMARSPWWPASAGALFIFALALSFAGYAIAARRAARCGRGTRRDFWLVLAVQVALNVWLALQPYLSSQDIFSYAFYSHIFVWYRANPYVAVPRDYPFDPLFSAIFWKDQPSNYGPLWTYLSALAPVIAGWRTGLTLLILKAIAIGAAVGGTPLIWDALGRLHPSRRVLGVTLYAWSPLLLVEAGEAGHNDVVMGFFLILTVWLWSRDRRTMSFAALMLAVLAKYVAVLLVPLFLVAWLREQPRRRWSVLVRTAALGAGLTVVTFAPLYAGLDTLNIVGFGANALAYTNSPLELAFRQIRVSLGESDDVANLPLHYQGYWVAARTPTILWSVPDTTKATGVALPNAEPLLVVELPAGEWLHVYEPRIARFGFVQFRAVQSISAPRPVPASGATQTVLEGAAQDPLAQRSNVLLRLVSVLLFLPGYVLIGRTIRDRSTLLRACLATLLLYLLVVQSWFWPWYLLWVLPLAAIETRGLASRSVLLLTVTTSVLNAQPSVSPSPAFEWLYEGRMLLIDGLPLLLIALAGRRGAEDGRRLSDAWHRLWVVVCRTFRLAAKLPIPLVTTAVLLFTVVAVANADKRGTGSNAGAAVIAWQRSFGEAQRRYSAGDYEGTVAALDQVLADRPDEMSVIRLRIAANLDMRRYGDAIPDLDRLVDGDPTSVDLLLERGSLYAQVQRSDRAMLDFRQAISLAPDNPAGYQGAGLVEFERGNLDPALDWLIQARSLAPQDGQLAQQLAAVYACEGDLPTAMSLYDQAIRLNPRDAQSYADRAALLRQAGYPDATVSDLQKVVVLSGDLQQNQWAARLLSSLTGPPGRASERTE